MIIGVYICRDLNLKMEDRILRIQRALCLFEIDLFEIVIISRQTVLYLQVYTILLSISYRKTIKMSDLGYKVVN